MLSARFKSDRCGIETTQVHKSPERQVQVQIRPLRDWNISKSGSAWILTFCSNQTVAGLKHIRLMTATTFTAQVQIRPLRDWNQASSEDSLLPHYRSNQTVAGLKPNPLLWAHSRPLRFKSDRCGIETRPAHTEPSKQDIIVQIRPLRDWNDLDQFFNVG